VKNPFSEEDLSGFVFAALGMIVIVFAGLFLGVATDLGSGLLSSSNSGEKLQAENDELLRRINKLEVSIEKIVKRQAVAQKNREHLGHWNELEKQVISAHKEVTILQQLTRNEQEAIKLITEGKEAYRIQYREHVRTGAIGKKFETITTRIGKKYHEVCITEVDPVGVSISHRDGAKRLGFREMPKDWQQKLIYSAAECAEAVAAEQKQQIVQNKRNERYDVELGKVRKTESARRKFSELLRQIASVNRKHSTAKLEASLARNKVSYQQSLRMRRTYSSSSYRYRYYNSSTGSYYSTGYRPRYRVTSIGSKSVPGSLETWEQRAVRYERATAIYAAKLASLRSRLASVDPSYAPYPATSP